MPNSTTKSASTLVLNTTSPNYDPDNLSRMLKSDPRGFFRWIDHTCAVLDPNREFMTELLMRAFGYDDHYDVVRDYVRAVDLAFSSLRHPSTSHASNCVTQAEKLHADYTKTLLGQGTNIPIGVNKHPQVNKDLAFYTTPQCIDPEQPFLRLLSFRIAKREFDNSDGQIMDTCCGFQPCVTNFYVDRTTGMPACNTEIFGRTEEMYQQRLSQRRLSIAVIDGFLDRKDKKATSDTAI